MSIQIVPLGKKHDRSKFSCGKAPLDRYITTQVSQDIRRKLATCFVICDEQDRVIGYYTLSSAGIAKEIVPDAIAKKMPRAYKELPVTLLGRLAVDKSYLKRGYGKILLVDALKRSLIASSETIASMAVVVDPIDVEAVSFYKKYEFIALQDSDRMFLPMATLAKAFERLAFR